MAIDPEAIVRVALKGQADIATGIVPPHLGDYTSTCKLLPYDPAQAKKLLAQAGYPDGKGFPKLPITFRNDMPQVESTVVVIAQQLKENLGIEVQPQPMPWADFLKERTAKTMPLSHLRWGADYADPQNFLSLLLHTSKKVNGKEDHEENGVGYSNPEFDALCDKADAEHDHAKRMAMYQQAEQIAITTRPGFRSTFSATWNWSSPASKTSATACSGICLTSRRPYSRAETGARAVLTDLFWQDAPATIMLLSVYRLLFYAHLHS